MARFVALSLLLFGCNKKAAEAPGELNDLLLFLTEHFEDEDPAELDAGLVAMNGLMSSMDLTGDVNDRSFTIAALTEDKLGGMDSHSGFSPEDQVPVGVPGLSKFDMEKQLEVVAETNHICIESDTTKFYRRTFETDLACFMDHSCDTLYTKNEIRKESVLANIWYDLDKEYRWFTLENGDQAMLARSWSPEVFESDGGGGSFDQTYLIEVWYPNGGDTQRFVAMWSSVSLALLSDGAWEGLVKGGLDQAGEFYDDYLNDFSDELCNVDRTREYDRE